MKVKKVRVRFADGVVREYLADGYEILQSGVLSLFYNVTFVAQSITETRLGSWFKPVTITIPGESHHVRHVTCQINRNAWWQVELVESQLEDPKLEDSK